MRKHSLDILDRVINELVGAGKVTVTWVKRGGKTEVYYSPEQAKSLLEPLIEAEKVTQVSSCSYIYNILTALNFGEIVKFECHSINTREGDVLTLLLFFGFGKTPVTNRFIILLAICSEIDSRHMLSLEVFDIKQYQSAVGRLEEELHGIKDLLDALGYEVEGPQLKEIERLQDTVEQLLRNIEVLKRARVVQVR